MLENPEVFTEDVIVDETFGLFTGAFATSMLTTQAVVCHFATKPESCAKARNEFEQTIKDTFDEYSTLKNLSKSDFLKATVVTDTTENLPYITQVVYEALRFSPPLVDSTEYYASKDIVSVNYEIKAGDYLNINIKMLHFKQNEWQCPYEFCPERFDYANPLSLTHEGKKRNPLSWVPFLGGRRVCFGQAFTM